MAVKWAVGRGDGSRRAAAGTAPPLPSVHPHLPQLTYLARLPMPPPAARRMKSPSHPRPSILTRALSQRQRISPARPLPSGSDGGTAASLSLPRPVSPCIGRASRPGESWGPVLRHGTELL